MNERSHFIYTSLTIFAFATGVTLVGCSGGSGGDDTADWVLSAYDSPQAIEYYRQGMECRKFSSKLECEYLCNRISDTYASWDVREFYCLRGVSKIHRNPNLRPL